jgi:hypothetical protein
MGLVAVKLGNVSARAKLTVPGGKVASWSSYTTGCEHNERCICKQGCHTRSDHPPWARSLHAQHFLPRLIVAHQPRLAVGHSFFVLHRKASVSHSSGDDRKRVAERFNPARETRLLSSQDDDAVDYSRETRYRSTVHTVFRTTSELLCSTDLPIVQLPSPCGSPHLTHQNPSKLRILAM